jgi:hypothetical protein
MPSRTPHARSEPDQQSRGYPPSRVLPAKIYPVVLLAVLLISQSSAQIRNIHLEQSFPVIQTASQIWIGTPAGLYQYSQSDDSFKRFALPGGRPGAKVRFLYFYKEWLWCVLDSGLAALQVRLNDWLFFNAKSGLPSDVVTGLDFQGDYVWASTPDGMARFDLLIEQWEVFDQRRGLASPDIADLASDGTEIWLISGRQLFNYNPQFEKWRRFLPSEDSVISLRRMFFLGDELWLVAAAGLIRFNPQLQRPQPYFIPYLASENLLELYLEGDRIWALTRKGLYYYEKQSGVWKEFEGNSALADAEIIYGQVSTQQVWVLTAKGTRVWDRNQKNWEILDYSTGLSSASYESVSSDGDLTFLFKPGGLEYRRTTRDPWRRTQFLTDQPATGAAGVLARLFDNPEGGSVGLGDYLWGWQGTRVSYLFEGVQQMFEDGSTSHTNGSSWRADAKSQFNLGSNRRITGFYNNVDYSDTRYGARFRGNDSDLVREVTWGDFRREPGAVPFGQPAELFGASAWLQAGPKTERFKKSLLTLKATTGEIRSRRTYEHYTGTSTEFNSTVRDANYAKNQFFSLPGLDPGVSPENVQIFVDDLAASDNTQRTTERTTLAGVIGDYDSWIPVEEYYFYERASVVRLLKPVLPSWTVVARFVAGGRAYEALLQHGGVSTARENFYTLGAQQIIPFSFEFTIADSLGAASPPSAFGLDADRDGRVDAQWLDADRGILYFPIARPFPPEVYDPLTPISRFQMQCRGRTERSIIQLQHRNLVRASETLNLDGIAATAGNDYVLDYTNGTLVFVREGIVNPDTRIEIEYEYYEADGNRLNAAGLNFSPSDDFYLQGDWQRLSRDSTNHLSVHGEIRQQSAGFDFRFIPGLVYQTREGAVTGKSAEALVSSTWLRLQGKYEDYGADYRDIYRPRAIFGDVNSRLSMFGALDVREDLRLTGEWTKARGFKADSSASSISAPNDERGSVALLFHRQDLPGAQVTYQKGKTLAGDSTETKDFVQGLLQYQLPREWSRAVFLDGLTLEYFLRLGRQSESWKDRFAKQDFSQTYYKVNALISEQFQAGFFYRSNTQHDLTAAGRDPISRSDRLLADIAFGEWRLVQVNARVENTLQQYSFPNSDVNNFYLRQFHQVNFRISPGQAWKPLSVLFFELNYNQSVNQADIARGNEGSRVWRLTGPADDATGSFQLSRNTFIRNEFRPGADWLLTTLFEWGDQKLGAGTSRLAKNSWQFNEKMDMRLTFETRLIAQYRHSYQEDGYQRLTRVSEPSLWLEQRWTPDILSTFQILYRRTRTDNLIALGTENDWEAMLDFFLRKDDFAGMRHLEFRQSLSGTYLNSEGVPERKIYRVGSGSSLDLYPVQSLIVRFRVDVARYVDEIRYLNTYDTVSFSVKLSLQL